MHQFFQKLSLLFIVGTIFAAFDIFAMSADTLIVGCRPWDDNVKSVSLGKAHCLDFMGMDRRQVGETTFHHVDLNDKDTYSASKFSKFAVENPQKFTTIILDWMTYHHIREDTAWTHFFELLRPNGKLFISIQQSLNFQTQEDTTNQKTAGLLEKLKKITPFSVQDFSYAHDSSLELSPSCLELLGRKYDALEEMSGTLYPDSYSNCRLKGNFIVATRTEKPS